MKRIDFANLIPLILCDFFRHFSYSFSFPLLYFISQISIFDAIFVHQEIAIQEWQGIEEDDSVNRNHTLRTFSTS